MQAKNDALKEAGAVVPDSFEAFEGAIKETYDKLVADGRLVPQPDTPAPSVPLDLEAAKKAGKVGQSCQNDLGVSAVQLLTACRMAYGSASHRFPLLTSILANCCHLIVCYAL